MTATGWDRLSFLGPPGSVHDWRLAGFQPLYDWIAPEEPDLLS